MSVRLADLIRREEPLSIPVALGRVLLENRLPISLKVFALLVDSPNEESLIHSLKKLRVDIAEIGGSVLFLTSVPFSAIEFIPSFHSFSDLSEIRDAVLEIFSSTIDLPEVIAPQKVCKEVRSDLCSDPNCPDCHFHSDFRINITNESLGFCSYLNLCLNPNCKYLHLFPLEGPQDAVLLGDQRAGSWIRCDIRKFPLVKVFSDQVSAILLDPPWDIHMELSYGTLSDDELRALPIQDIHASVGGFAFIWATSRTVEVARDCLRIWGYTRVDEILWIKVNQFMGTVRSGRTGHWLNHNKEHCLVGVKGHVPWANSGMYRQDCDVIVAPVGQNSKKPVELYSIIERLVCDNEIKLPCLELFGRNHNRRPGWITLGNQLDDPPHVAFPQIAQRLKSFQL